MYISRGIYGLKFLDILDELKYVTITAQMIVCISSGLERKEWALFSLVYLQNGARGAPTLLFISISYPTG